METNLTISQKILLIVLYGLLFLMIIFSIWAYFNNLGQEGFDNCVEKQCEKHGEEFCRKQREINNCCMGAGGKLGISNGNYICVFE